MLTRQYKKLAVVVFLLLAVPLGVFGVKKAVLLFPKAFGVPASFVVDMENEYGVSSDPWNNLAQGGEEKGRMISPVAGEVAKLKPKYIRIDHVFDFYTQEELDVVISDILATGAKPFISLSYMPANIAQGGDITGLPNNWTDWENLVQRTVERISGANGLGIKNVYYEVWNEPDLFGKFKMYGPKNYSELYYHTVIGAQRAKNVHPFKIGGPATTGFYENWMKGLLKYVSSNSLRMDFLSWHRYSKKMADYEDDVRKARELLGYYDLSGKEMIISEMGPNSEIDPVYDGKFSAIHTLSTAVVLQDEVSMAFNFEIKDGPGNEKYWGRWGMFTHEKFGKPEKKLRATAISFANNMLGGTKLNMFGQGTYVRGFAKKMNDKITRILIVNYDPRVKNAEVVPLKFVKLPSNEFSYKRIDFAGGSSSVNVVTKDNEWQTQEQFLPGSASIFEIVFK